MRHGLKRFFSFLPLVNIPAKRQQNPKDARRRIFGTSEGTAYPRTSPSHTTYLCRVFRTVFFTKSVTSVMSSRTVWELHVVGGQLIRQAAFHDEGDDATPLASSRPPNCA